MTYDSALEFIVTMFREKCRKVNTLSTQISLLVIRGGRNHRCGGDNHEVKRSFHTFELEPGRGQLP